MCTHPVVNRICRESYTAPEDVYSRLKRVGMDLVTLTDHDSISGGECLRKHRDFFLSEEITCHMPSGTELHIGVLDITERDHIEVQRRRNDLPRLLAWMTERRLLFTVNHMFSGVTGRRERDDFSWFRAYFPAVETRNGHMLPFHNREAERFAAGEGKIALGGSDSHALPTVGGTYTEVPGARDKTEFIRGLWAGKAVVRGTHGSYFKLTRDILHITGSMIRETPWTAPLAPLAVLVPVATFATSVNDMIFARRWSARAFSSEQVRNRLPDASRQLPAEVFAWP